MCGIIGYVGKRPAKDLLLEGLRRLEFRGYDSAGIVLNETDGLDYMRAVGNLANLQRVAGENGSHATAGLGHTRWATHGAVTEENAHPLTGCDDAAMAIVVNGIVENYRELKIELKADGHRFSSADRRRGRRPPDRGSLRGRSRRGGVRLYGAASRGTSPSSSCTTTTPT